MKPGNVIINKWVLLSVTSGLIVVQMLVAGCAPTGTSTASLSAISILPSPGNYLTNSENESSEVLLMEVEISEGISNKKYDFPSDPPVIVNVGDSILIVSGRMRNEHPQNKEIALYAVGCDEDGKQVAWTLDATHIIGQIGLHLEYYQAGYFVLHLNTAENIKSIRIYGNNYNQVPP